MSLRGRCGSQYRGVWKKRARGALDKRVLAAFALGRRVGETPGRQKTHCHCSLQLPCDEGGRDPPPPHLSILLAQLLSSSLALLSSRRARGVLSPRCLASRIYERLTFPRANIVRRRRYFRSVRMCARGCPRWSPDVVDRRNGRAAVRYTSPSRGERARDRRARAKT